MRLQQRRAPIPRPVLFTAFATTIAFMGIGVVDPILPVIARAMGARPWQVEMLFTTYIAVMALAMLVSGVLSSRLGGRRTMLLGLVIVVVFATLSGRSNGVWPLAAARGGWGLGNALFTSTALVLIVGLSQGGVARSIALYEAALGIGISSGPLLGGFLGAMNWRYPFYGTATLMFLALVATYLTVPEPAQREKPRRARDMFEALRSRPVLVTALAGLGYSYAFFTILAYSPLYLHLRALPLGITYFGWGVLVAISSVFVVRWLRGALGPMRLLRANLMLFVVLMLGLYLAHGVTLSLALIVLSGVLCGIANAMFTSLAIEVSPFTRSVSSATYNFLRWSGAAIAPVGSGLLAQFFGPSVPFLVAAGMLGLSIILLLSQGRMLEERLQAEAN